MSKNIAVLGGGVSTALVMSMLSESGFNPVHPSQINHRTKRFYDVDLTNNAKQPVKSTYGSKQRKRKAKRKGIK